MPAGCRCYNHLSVLALFGGETGKTAAYFLGGMLYAEACRLLTRTDYTAQQIAEELNFSDQSAFGKFFKSKAGVSPHIFRLKGVNR